MLFKNVPSWEKKSGNPDFEVSLGCYDGAEVFELVGIYILKNLSKIIDKGSIELCRDDVLEIFENLSGP